MESQVSRVKAQMLALVAWADGSFSDDEQEVFIQLLDESTLDADTRLELVDFIDQPPDKASALDGLSSVPFHEAFGILEVAFALALSDGSLHDAEREVIDEMMDRLGIEGREREGLYATLGAQS
jgi:tellurite resistance protein